MLLGRVEGLLKVVGRVGLGQLVEVNEVWPASGTRPLEAPRPTEGAQAAGLPPICPTEGTQAAGLPPVCPTADLCLWIRALKANPSLQLVVKFWMFTSG